MQGEVSYQGNAELDLDKVVAVIRYFAASERVTGLYKVKLMKLLWYADMLSYKERSTSITGLVYRALPMGAVPIGHQFIIHLKGVPCKEVNAGEHTAYHFHLDGGQRESGLSDREMAVLETVIDRLGGMSTSEIVEFVHREQAYVKTEPGEVISFRYAADLQI